jgi:hypothetical protein
MSEIKQFVDENLEEIRTHLRESYSVVSFEIADNILELVQETEGVVTFPGYDCCLVGLSMDDRAVYSMEMIVKKLVKDNEWEWHEAQEYFDFNILNVKTSAQDPVFV